MHDALTVGDYRFIMAGCLEYRSSTALRYMYYRDHAPPHFHAIYGEYDAEVDIATGAVVQGDLPRRARALVTEWTDMHRDELQQNWTLARAAQPLNPIQPLQ